MEKIQIQFNDHDYQIYYNYCLRYYTVRDATRKRSIRLFLELFEKDILSVGEHDLGDAFLFFSKKCDEFQASHSLLGKNNSPPDHPQFNTCRDILFLIEDFEKIYRLIEKTGIASDYLLVMATFSRIIEEENKAYLVANNEHDREKIAPFIPGITDIIRTRLGPDAGWELVLFELARIIHKFNLASPDRKIEQNWIFLIGTAVVPFFNADVGTGEIQSHLADYLEERELAEFESVLNNTPNSAINIPDPDTGDNTIFEILGSIADKEDIDEGMFETLPEPVNLTTTDLPAVISSSVITSTTPGITPYRQFTPYPHRIFESYPSRFAIEVSDSIKSVVVLPENRNDSHYPGYMKSGIPRYSLVFMGLIVLIMFGITIAATSGIWTPVKIMANTSSGISSTSQSAALQKNSSPVAISVPVVFLHSPPVQASNPIQPQPTTTVQLPTTPSVLTSADINKHFMRVAFGSDSQIKKYTGDDPMSTALTGDYDDNDTFQLEHFEAQFNNYSSTNQFRSGLKYGDQASIVVIFSPGSTLSDIDFQNGAVISKDPKTGIVHYIHETVTVQYVSKDMVYINSDYKGDERTHWMLRGLLSELGFQGETNDYPDSIFYAGSDNSTQLSDIDLKALDTMYSTKIANGMSFDRVKSLLLL
jgi:hypothetical protein